MKIKGLVRHRGICRDISGVGGITKDKAEIGVLRGNIRIFRGIKVVQKGIPYKQNLKQRKIYFKKKLQ